VDCPGGEVTQVRIPKEALHQMWEPLQPVQRCRVLELDGTRGRQWNYGKGEWVQSQVGEEVLMER
jgi:hypothetical protein